MGKSMLEGKITEELNFFIARLKEFEGPVDLRFTVQISVSNIIGSIVWGYRSDYDDPAYIKTMKMLTYNSEKVGSSGALVAFPFLK